MQQRVKRIEKLVKLLKDPDPRFVSLVDYGANQTPFNSLKRAELITPLKRKKAQSNAKGECVMAKRKSERLSRKAVSQPTALRKLVFDKEEFADETAVKAWLEGHDYEGELIIADDEDVFEASEKDVTDEDFESLRTVKTETAGVHGVVGVLTEAAKEQAEADEEDEAVEKTAEAEVSEETEADEPSEEDEKPVIKSKKTKGIRRRISEVEKTVMTKSVISQKFDPWAAWLSEESSVEEIIKDGMRDGMPPGFDDILLATTKAMANTLKSGDDVETKLSSIGTEMAGLVFKVHSVFAELAKSEDEDAKKAAEAYAEQIEKTLLLPEEPFVQEIEDEGEESVEKTDPVQTSASEGTDSSLNELLGIVKSIADSVDGLTDQVDEVKKAAESADEKAENATKRVEEYSMKAPTKKSAPLDGSDQDDDEEDEMDEFAYKMTRNIFGA